MFQYFTAWTIASVICYLAAVLFLLWMAYRFVKAHEMIAKLMQRRELRESGKDPDKLDRYNF